MFNLKQETERNCMVLDHVQLAKTLSMKFPNLPYEDRFQEACLGLMKAFHSYKPSREVSFGSYAKVVIMNQLRQYYKKEKMRFYFVIQGDQFTEVQDINYIRRSPNYYDYIELKEDLRKHFGDFKVKILIEIINGKTQEACSQAFGISQPTISRIVKQMREVFGGELT